MSEDTPVWHEYEVVVAGGGPAGLSAALYSTRLGHSTALVDRGGGRAAMMQDVHNLVGTTEETSGMEFLRIGQDQLENYGCEIHRDLVGSGGQTDDGRFRLCGNDADYVAEAVVLATGFDDVRPDPPLPRTGKGLHYCLHCDAHMFADRSVYVMGHAESAAHVAAIMLDFTDEVDLLTRGEPPEWSDETATMLDNHPIDVVHADVTGVQNGEDGWLKALEFEDSVGPRPTGSRTESGDGSVREYRGGFAMYGAEYDNGLARELGCAVNDDGTVEVDEQGPVRSEEVPGIPDELLEQAVEFHTYD